MQKNLITVLAALCFALATTAQIPTSGQVAYWPMNGNFTDAGPNAINVTNTGATATTNGLGMLNKAMFFNNTLSTNGSIVQATIYATATINSAINFSESSSFTVAHWFKLTNIAAAGLGSGFFDNSLNYNGFGTWHG